MNYFRLVDDLDIDGRWFLKSPLRKDGEEVDPRAFTCGRVFESENDMSIIQRYRGCPLDFTFADFDLPVVTSQVGECIQELDPKAVQRIPVKITDGRISLKGHEILNVLSTLDCLDEERSTVRRWTCDSPRPDKAGQYRMVTNLAIDRSQVGSSKVFRISGWEIALIVSEEILLAFERTRVKGVRFEKVTHP